MNRLKVLKQNKNESLQSNASHDGYESAMDETMGSTQSASMYFSMTEADDDDDAENISAGSSNNMSMDETIAAAPNKNHQHQHQHNNLLDGMSMNPDKSAAMVSPSPKRLVLQPIFDADDASLSSTKLRRSNFLSPQMNRRNSLTSTPVATPKASSSVVLSPGGVTFDEERSPGQLQRSLKTVRKMVVPTAEAEETCSAVENATGSTIIAMSDSQPDVSSIAVSTVVDALPANEEPMDVSMCQQNDHTEPIDTVTSLKNDEESVANRETLSAAFRQSRHVTSMDEKNEISESAVAESEDVVQSVASRKSLTAAFRQTRRGTLASRSGLDTIGETSGELTGRLLFDRATEISQILFVGTNFLKNAYFFLFCLLIFHKLKSRKCIIQYHVNRIDKI